MRELWPNPSDSVDIAVRLDGDKRESGAARPWVTMVMIASLDGGIQIDGVSGGLGNDADHQRFVAARRMADAIVVGSRTAMVENYRPATVPIAVVSGRLRLDPAARLFSDPTNRPIIYTTNQAARTNGSALHGIAEIVALGDSIRPTQVLADLADRGSKHVALEGGATLNGSFLEDDAVDEVLLSVAPLALGGTSGRLAHGAEIAPRSFALDRVLIDGDHLFVRYLRD